MVPRKILVVANKTLHGEPIRQAVSTLMARGPATFVLLVPAEIPGGTIVWEESEVWNAAERRLTAVVIALRSLGADVTGRVGAHVPYNAIMDLLAEQTFDEVVISTLPSSISAWLGLDLPNRIRRDSGLPVTHLIFDPGGARPLETHPAWDRPTG